MRYKQTLYTNHLLATYLFVCGLSLFAIGITWSVFLVTNSVFILSLLIAFRFDDSLNTWKLNNKIQDDLDQFIKNPLLLSMLFYFLSVLLSGLWSEQIEYWLWFSRMQLPFLLLPIAFYINGRLSQNQWNTIFYIFLLSAFCCSVFLLIQYFLNYTEVNLLILKGKPIVTHISHIRFSIILAIAAMISLHYSFESFTKPGFKYRWIFPFAMIYFFIVNHLFSVKTGIIGMDLGLVVYTTIYFLQRRAYKSLGIAFGLIVLLLLFAFIMFPSLQNKFYYTIFQLAEWKRGKWTNYSDLERWVSFQMGIEMIKQNPVLGSGMGDLYQVTRDTYMECLNHNEPKLPHNQFLFSWAFTGLPSLISLLAMIYYSAFQKKWIGNPLITSIQTILLFSFLFEYTLGTQIGCSLYVFFTLISWAMLRDQS